MADALTNTSVSKLKPKSKPYEVRDGALRGLLVRVQPSGIKTYYFEYYRHKRVKIGPAGERGLQVPKAREIAKGYLAEHYSGDDPIEKRRRVQALNYLEFLEQMYKPHLVATLRNGIANDVNVRETMACLINGFPELHSLALDEITALQIEKWRQRRRQEGASPARIHRQLNDLRACFNRAVKWEALKVNPLNKVERIKVDHNAKVRYLTLKEEKALREELVAREALLREGRRNHNEWLRKRGYKVYRDLDDQEFADYLRPAVLLSLNTGMRRGELFGLKWSDVNFEKEHITISGAMAKSGKTRHIPLNSEAMHVLTNWKKQPGLKSSWVFPGSGESGHMLRVDRGWTAVLDEAKIANFRWHDLRHTFASKLVMAGENLNTVRELLGHSDYKMTLRYAHLAPEHKREAVNKLVAAK